MNEWVLSILNVGSTSLIEWASIVLGAGFLGLSASKIQDSIYHSKFSGILSILKTGGLFTSVGTFLAGILLVMFAALYAGSVNAPISWFQHLPAKEASFFRSATDHRKDPISIFDFANIESKYQEIAPSHPKAMLTEQRDAMIGTSISR